MANMKPAVIATLIILGLGVGFAGGYFFRNQQLTKLRGNFAMGEGNGNIQRFNGANRGGANQAGGMRPGLVSGNVLSMDDKSITVKLTDGSSKIVLFSDSTQYSNMVESTLKDITIGKDVSIIGTTNNDGSITAISIQLNPVVFKQINLVVPNTK